MIETLTQGKPSDADALVYFFKAARLLFATGFERLPMEKQAAMKAHLDAGAELEITADPTRMRFSATLILPDGTRQEVFSGLAAIDGSGAVKN